MNQIIKFWREYNVASQNLQSIFGKTSNIVEEYGRFLMKNHLSVKVRDTSHKNPEIIGEKGEVYQIKSRKVTSGYLTIQLGKIESWNFDFLGIVLFGELGDVVKALICPIEVAKEYSYFNKCLNAFTITTTSEFLNDSRIIELTKEIQLLNEGDNGLNEIENTQKIEVDKLSIDQEIKKVKRKIPKWFQNASQINAQILIEFMAMKDMYNGIEIKKDDLKRRCRSIPSFSSNLNQMSIISNKNHAKVFDIKGNFIYLWGPVKSFIEAEYNKIKHRLEK